MTTLSGQTDNATRQVSWHHAAICLVAGLGLIGLFFVDAFVPALGRVEHWTADWRTVLLSHRLETTYSKLAIIEIDSDTLEPYPFMLPIDRSLQADIVNAADSAGARAIALDFYYTKATVPAADEKLIKTLRTAKAKIILGAYENKAALKPRHIDYQYRFIERANAKAGYLNLNLDADGVIRSRAQAPIEARHKESFSKLLADFAGRRQTGAPNKISWLRTPVDASSTFITIKAHKLLNGPSAQLAALLRDRVVIVAGSFGYFDRHRTPFSLLRGLDMSGAEIHAHMAAELIDGGRSYWQLNASQQRIFLVAMVIFGVMLGWRFRRRRFDFLDWRAVSVLFLAVDAALFKFAFFILPFTSAALAWVLSVTLGTQIRDATLWFKRKASGHS